MEKHKSYILSIINDALSSSNPAKNYNRALRLAAREGYLFVVKKLLTHPRVQNNIATLNNHAFHMAVQSGNLAIVKKLLLYKKVIEKITAGCNLALQIASSYGYFDIVIELLKYKQVVYAIKLYGNTALQKAALYDHLKITNKLLTYQVVKNRLISDQPHELSIKIAIIAKNFDIALKILEVYYELKIKFPDFINIENGSKFIAYAKYLKRNKFSNKLLLFYEQYRLQQYISSKDVMNIIANYANKPITISFNVINKLT